jgi:hypothetical protein
VSAARWTFRPNGGNGGFIETSAAQVHIADNAQITTAAGVDRHLPDRPQDFNMGI